MYARMTPIVGTIHISTRIEFCVASDCTAFGTYPVSSRPVPVLTITPATAVSAMLFGHAIPTISNKINPIGGSTHAIRNAFFLDNTFVTFGKIRSQTTYATDALIINADNIPALLHT